MRAVVTVSLQCGHCARRERQSRCRSGACSGPGSAVAVALGPGCPPAALAASPVSHSAQIAGLVQIYQHLMPEHPQPPSLSAVCWPSSFAREFILHSTCNVIHMTAGEPLALQACLDDMQDAGTASCDMQWITITLFSPKAGRQHVHSIGWRLTGSPQAVAL